MNDPIKLKYLFIATTRIDFWSISLDIEYRFKHREYSF